MSTSLLAVLKSIVLPPGGLVTALLFAALLWRWWPRTAIALAIAVSLAFIALCTPRVSLWLSAPIERIAPAPASDWRGAQAIVVLGGGRASALPGRSRERVNLDTFARVAEAARISRHTRLPILVTGGRPGGERRSEAQLMNDALIETFGMPSRWLENHSHNTRENALYSALILREHKVRKVILVTSAFHMARAERNFERLGFEVVPAPVSFSSAPPGLRGWLPSSLGLAQSQRALHEYLGWIAGR
ncbi:YdcF family protein [Halotalea alkalilenta]|uniref:DUF218 domain-containing protein n=1 Tax=Halotalea alkalilenta TaxID=376489 RepID=A0A172YGZ2_9GAMM|nr:YdcF family protein [Halotalea alkalilenta]ANF58467.1 hypothetical protein A5892_14115 [Halotalea alkalilenta]